MIQINPPKIVLLYKIHITFKTLAIFKSKFMVLSTFAVLYNYHPQMFSELIHHPDKNTVLIRQKLPIALYLSVW